MATITSAFCNRALTPSGQMRLRVCTVENGPPTTPPSVSRLSHFPSPMIWNRRRRSFAPAPSKPPHPSLTPEKAYGDAAHYYSGGNDDENSIGAAGRNPKSQIPNSKQTPSSKFQVPRLRRGLAFDAGVANRQSPIANRQSPSANRQAPSANRQAPSELSGVGYGLSAMGYRGSVWCLKFVWDLVFGIWDFGHGLSNLASRSISEALLYTTAPPAYSPPHGHRI